MGERTETQATKAAVADAKKEFGNLGANGAIKVDVTQESLNRLKEAWATIERMPEPYQQDLFKKLLLTKNTRRKK